MASSSFGANMPQYTQASLPALANHFQSDVRKARVQFEGLVLKSAFLLLVLELIPR
jgi:hypothetical protein